MAAGEDETGTRYDVALDVALPSLAGVPRAASGTGPASYDVEATFVDTPELALTLAGVTLRRRTGGPDEGWRLGLPTARGRFEVPAPLDESGDAAPESLRSAVQLFLRGGELEPLAVVRARTAVHEVLDSRGRVLAEVRDEHITAQTTAVLGEEPAPRAWRAWEIRLVGGDLHVHSAVAGLMEDAGATPAPSGSTLRRALGDRTRGRSAPLEVGTDSSAHEVVRAHLVRLVRELRTLDPLVRVDAPDAVHQMRVLARRLRSTLATYRPLLDAEVTDPMRQELAWVAGVLGEARDAEVLRRRLLRQLDEEPPELVRGTIRTFVDRDLEERYREDHDRCVEALSSGRYLALVERLTAASASPPWAPGTADAGQGLLHDRLRHAYKRVRRRVDALPGAHDEQDHARRLHEVRKAAKRLRYSLEPLVTVAGKPAARLEKAMKRVQSVLGDHQDSTVTRVELRSLSDRATGAGVNAFALGLLDARQEAQAARDQGRFAAAWERASRKKHRRWLS